jgi:hypothetical protein
MPVKNQKRYFFLSSLSSFLLGGGLVFYFLSHKENKSRVGEDHLLSIVKDDSKTFEKFFNRPNGLDIEPPLIDGKKLDEDELVMSVKKDQSEILEKFLALGFNLNKTYGPKKWNLLHFAGKHCSHKVTSFLKQKTSLDWNDLGQDGASPLTLAAENGCLKILDFWKKKRADFHFKDGRGISVESILNREKGQLPLAYLENHPKIIQTKVSRATPPQLYKRRTIVSDIVLEDDKYVTPERHVNDAIETAEISEFAD